MANKQKPDWSDVPGLDGEARVPTPREQHLADLAEKNKDVEPQSVDVTNKNAKTPRVIHDFDGKAVTIPPGEKKLGVLLHPNAVEYLRRAGSDLELVKAT